MKQFIVGLIVLLSVGCYNPGGACLSGETQTCVCPGGRSGAQTCNSQGTGWGSLCL